MTPSPTITTPVAPVRSSCSAASFCSGSSPPRAVSMDSDAGDGADRLLAVAAEDGGAHPELVQPADGAGRLLAQWGGDGQHADRPDRRAPPRPPSRRGAGTRSAASSSSPGSGPVVRPHHPHGPAATRPATPIPGRTATSSASWTGAGGRRGWLWRWDARCRLPPPTPGPAPLRPSVPRAGATATTVAIPMVSVPVLSNATVSTPASRSRASALRMRMPRAEARPHPTIIATGVASPMAQGHATRRTAMELRTAVPRFEPTSHQPRNVAPARRSTTGTNTALDPVGEALERRLLAQGVVDDTLEPGQDRFGSHGRVPRRRGRPHRCASHP